MVSKRIALFAAVGSALSVGLIFAVGTFYRLGWRPELFGRELAFGTLFSLAVWWWCLRGFPKIEELFLKNWARPGRIAACFLTAIVFSYAVIWLDERAQWLHIDEDLDGYVEPEYANEFRAVVTAAIIVVLSQLLDLTRRYFTAKLDAEQLKQQHAAARFELLKQQVNPHFLFNSLNVLKTMTDAGSPRSGEFIVRLSEFYRSALVTQDAEAIPLADELALLDHYAFMLEARFEGKFSVEKRVEGVFLKSLVPPFCLQLLLENCIKHNVISASRPLLVEIFTENGGLVVRNNQQPKRNVSEPSSGTGLQNIDARFRLLAGGRGIEVAEGGGFFTVRLPLVNSNPKTAEP